MGLAQEFQHGAPTAAADLRNAEWTRQTSRLDQRRIDWIERSFHSSELVAPFLPALMRPIFGRDALRWGLNLVHWQSLSSSSCDI
jgi:hypothetical protein